MDFQQYSYKIQLKKSSVNQNNGILGEGTCDSRKYTGQPYN